MGVFRLVGVPRIKQQHDMSCWYAAARVVCGTFIQGPLIGMGSPEANQNGFAHGLSNGGYFDFQSANHLRPLEALEPEVMKIARSVKTYPPGIDFKRMLIILNHYGPLWTVIRMGKHAIVLVGGQTDADEEYILYHDPADASSEKVMKYDIFRADVHWDVKGILAHYDKIPKAFSKKERPPPLSGVVSASRGLNTIGTLPQDD